MRESTPALVRRPSAADVVALSRHEARGVGGEEMHHSRHLLRASHPPHRDLAPHVLDGFRLELVEQRRLDDPRRYAVYPHAVADHLLGQRLGQADYPGLRDRVGGHVRVALLARDGGHVDYRAASALAHVRDHRPAAIEDAGQVEVKHLLPVLVGGLPERGVAPCYTGVVHQYVYSAEGVERALDHRADLGRAGDVRGHPGGLASSLAQPFGDRGGAIFGDVRDHHLRTGPREALGDREPYPPRRPGDDRDPSRQFQEHSLTPLATPSPREPRGRRPTRYLPGPDVPGTRG